MALHTSIQSGLARDWTPEHSGGSCGQTRLNNDVWYNVISGPKWTSITQASRPHMCYHGSVTGSIIQAGNNHPGTIQTQTERWHHPPALRGDRQTDNGTERGRERGEGGIEQEARRERPSMERPWCPSIPSLWDISFHFHNESPFRAGVIILSLISRLDLRYELMLGLLWILKWFV